MHVDSSWEMMPEVCSNAEVQLLAAKQLPMTAIDGCSADVLTFHAQAAVTLLLELPDPSAVG